MSAHELVWDPGLPHVVIANPFVTVEDRELATHYRAPAGEVQVVLEATRERLARGYTWNAESFTGGTDACPRDAEERRALHEEALLGYAMQGGKVVAFMLGEVATYRLDEARFFTVPDAFRVDHASVEACDVAEAFVAFELIRPSWERENVWNRVPLDKLLIAFGRAIARVNARVRA